MDQRRFATLRSANTKELAIPRSISAEALNPKSPPKNGPITPGAIGADEFSAPGKEEVGIADSFFDSALRQGQGPASAAISRGAESLLPGNGRRRRLSAGDSPRAAAVFKIPGACALS